MRLGRQQHRRIPAAAKGVALATILSAGPASAAYFHQTHRSDVLQLSDIALKERFVLPAAAATASLGAAGTAEILAAPAGIGPFEQDDGIRVPGERCGEDSPKARRCELEWESKHFAAAKGVATRKGNTLTLKSANGHTLVLRDWNTCAPPGTGECDAERFTYLGPLGHSSYQAVEIGYGHDSPSLVLFHAKSGKMLSIHFGSEPTFVNPSETLLTNSEDLNDATSFLVTSLDGDAPALDLQCLGKRTAEQSFGVTFKRWATNMSADVVLTESRKSPGADAETSRQIAVRLERSPDGTWTVKSATDLKAEGFECHERATPRAAR